MRRCILVFGVLCGVVNLSIAQGEAGSLSLEEAVNMAVERNLSVKLGEINSEMAKENVNQAYMGLLPNVNAFGSHGYNWGQTIDPFTNTFATSRVRNNNLGVSSNWTLFGGFQRQYGLAQRKAEQKASELELEQNKNDISIQVAQAYLQTVYSQGLVGVAEEQLALSNQQYDRVKQQFELGQVSNSTLLDMEAQRATDELGLTNAENQYRMARLQFFQLIQSEEEETKRKLELPDIGKVNAKMVANTPAGIYSIALENLPDVQAQEYRLKASEKSLGAARGGYLPSLSINASYGSGYSGNNVIGVGNPTITTDTVPLFTTSGEQIIQLGAKYDAFETKSFKDQINDNINKSLSFSVSLPLFNGGSTRSNVKRTKLSVIQSRIQLDQAKNTLRQKVETSWNDALAAYKTLLSSEKAASSQQQAFDNAKIRFEENLITSIDFNDIKIRLARAKVDLIQAQVDYIFKTKVLDFYKGENLSLK